MAVSAYRLPGEVIGEYIDEHGVDNRENLLEFHGRDICGSDLALGQ